MRHRAAWLYGVIGLGAIAYLRRRRSAPPALDPAQELRRKLEESRGLAEERERFEERETPVDEAESAPADLDERRRQIHEQARAAVQDMHSPTTSD
jgi:hypothetical protein